MTFPLKKIFLILWIGTCLFPSLPKAAETEAIRLAVIHSHSGMASDFYRPVLNAAMMAVEEINRNGGLLGNPATCIVVDNSSTPIGSKQAAEMAVSMKAHGVIGALWSSHSLAAAPVLQKAGIPMISPGSTKPVVTLTGDFIFRVCFIDSFQGKVMARYAKRELGMKTAVVMKNIDEEYCVTLGDYFSRYFEDKGCKILWEGRYRGKAVDFSDSLSVIRQLKPDVVFLPGYSRDSGMVIRQAKRMGVETVFMGGDGWDASILKYGGEALDGSYLSDHWHPGIPSDRNQRIVRQYRRKYAEPMTAFAALAYDAAMVFADAVRRAGTSNRSAIRKALAETEGFPGVTGIITFDANGDPRNKSASILKYEKGKRVFVKTVSYDDQTVQDTAHR